MFQLNIFVKKNYTFTLKYLKTYKLRKLQVFYKTLSFLKLPLIKRESVTFFFYSSSKRNSYSKNSAITNRHTLSFALALFIQKNVLGLKGHLELHKH